MVRPCSALTHFFGVIGVVSPDGPNVSNDHGVQTSFFENKHVSFDAQMNRVHRFVTNDFTVRAASVIATDVVREMQNLQKTYPLATVGVGRAMVGALLMASHLKEKHEIGLLFRGNGPMSTLYAEASFDGHVRGYCPHPQYQDFESSLNLGRAIGSGTLTVARHQPFQKSAFSGTVDLQTGEVGDDLAHYLHQSQQIRSIVSLGVYLDTYGRVLAAGGTLVEVMPGVEDDVIDVLEKNSQKLTTSVSELILNGVSPQKLIEPLLLGLPHTEIPHEYEVRYFCPCTQDRAARALALLGADEIQDMLDKSEPAEIQCQVCGRKYILEKAELTELRDRLRKQAMH